MRFEKKKHRFNRSCHYESLDRMYNPVYLETWVDSIELMRRDIPIVKRSYAAQQVAISVAVMNRYPVGVVGLALIFGKY